MHNLGENRAAVILPVNVVFLLLPLSNKQEGFSVFTESFGFTSKFGMSLMTLLNCEQEGQVLKCLRADFDGPVS